MAGPGQPDKIPGPPGRNNISFGPALFEPWEKRQKLPKTNELSRKCRMMNCMVMHNDTVHLDIHVFVITALG